MKTAFGMLLVLAGWLLVMFGKQSSADAGSPLPTPDTYKNRRTILMWVGAATTWFGLALQPSYKVYQEPFKQDIITTYMAVILLIVLPLGIADSSFNNQGRGRMLREHSSVFLFGLGVIAVATLTNSIQSHRWDKQYLIAFFTFKECGVWLWRAVLPLAYLLVAIGVVSLIQGMFKKNSPNKAL